ncbi:hypothetical protein ACFQV4_01430 [Streptomyces thermocarboxydus]
MPKSPSGGIGHVPVAVYSCAAESAAIREAERRARHYADTRHWHVAGTWSDDDPSTALDARPAWAAVTSALSSGLIRGIVVAGITHLAEDAGQFAALGVLIRDRGGFLAEATSPPAARRRGSTNAAASCSKSPRAGGCGETSCREPPRDPGTGGGR